MSIDLIRDLMLAELDDVLTDIHQLTILRDRLGVALDALTGTTTPPDPEANGGPLANITLTIVEQKPEQAPKQKPTVVLPATDTQVIIVSPKPTVTAFPPTPPTPTPTGTRAGAGGKFDYTPIAKIYNELIAAGHPSVTAELARRLGVSEAAAKNYPPRMRKLGLIPETSRENVAPVAAATVERRVVTENPARFSVTTNPTTATTAASAEEPIGFQCDEPGCGHQVAGETTNGRNQMRSHIRLNHTRNATTLELMAGVLG